MAVFFGGSMFADEHTVWEEDWNSSTNGTKVEDVSNSNATYEGDNGAYIKLYPNANDATNLELLVPKKSRSLSFTANVALNGEKNLSLTFTVNKNIEVTSSTTGASLTKIDNSNYTITVPEGTNTLSLTFTTAVDQNARLDDIKLTSEDGEVNPDALSAPTITGDTSFEESATVTITTTEEGATILYTVNGDDPTTAGQTYTAPFTVNATTTVKAVVKKGDKFSPVASKTFTKVELSGVTTIAAFNALANNTTNVVLTLTNAKVLAYGNNSAVINDGTAGTELYNLTTVAMKQGDILNGTVTGTKADYKGITEMTNITENTLVVTEGTVVPTVATVAEVADAEIFGALYKLENVQVVKDGNNYYMKDGDVQMQVYNSLKIAGIKLAEGQFNIEGVVSAYNTKQFLPTKFEAYVAPSDVPAPTISGDESFEEQTTITITTDVEGGAIYYTTDGTDPASSATRQDYTAPFVITETTTVKACVENEDGDLSSTVSKTFTKASANSAANIAAFNALTDKTAGVVLTLTNAQVLAKGGNYTIVADATAGTEFFKVTTPELKAGDILNGTITGTKDSYNGVPELTTVTANTLVITEGTVTATTADVATIAEAPLFTKYYALENVEVVEEGGKYYMQSGTTKVQVYNQFKPTGLTLAAGNYNIEGVVGIYGEAKQFWPTKFEKNLGEKQDPALAFAEASYTAILGEAFTSPALVNEKNVAVEWTSTNEAVATVANDGTVTILAAGTTTITAASAETDEFVASSVSYTLIVSDPAILEKGTFENPLTVADLLTLNADAIPFTEEVWVKGIIIGSCKSSGALEETPATNSNIAIADAAGDTEKYAPVQLPTNKDANGNIRSTLNVVDTPTNIGKEVMIKGQILKYMSRVGVKNTSAYVFNGISSGINNVSVVTNSNAPLYNLAGQRVGKDFKGIVLKNGKKIVIK